MTRTLQSLARALSEPVMGFVALTALALAVIPLIFDLSPRASRFVDFLDWPIIGMLALEYGIKLGLAPSKRKFATDPWRVLDLFIIVAPFAALLPDVSDGLRSSPALRVLRLVRVAMLGARTGQVVTRDTKSRRAVGPGGPIEVRIVAAEGELRPSDWGEFENRLKDAAPEWFHVSGVQAAHVAAVAKELGIPEPLLAGKLADASYPRIDAIEGRSIVFAWHPEMIARSDGSFALERHGVVVVAAGQSLVTLSAGRTDLPVEASRLLSSLDKSMPLLVRTMYAILKAFLARYQTVVSRLEEEVRKLEVLTAEENSQEFLKSGFRIRKDLAGVANDLWHLSQAIAALKENRVRIAGLEESHRVLFGSLGEDAEYMHEMAGRVKETLISIIELHMNATSFQMNKLMKLLAIVTTLALIPTVVGGLLGMNIAGNPWPLELSHVAFGIGAGMALCLYVFAVKGWLR